MDWLFQSKAKEEETRINYFIRNLLPKEFGECFWINYVNAQLLALQLKHSALLILPPNFQFLALVLIHFAIMGLEPAN
jgi:hypothetical protein